MADKRADRGRIQAAKITVQNHLEPYGAVWAAWSDISRLLNHFLDGRLDYCEDLMPTPSTPRPERPGYGGYGDVDEPRVIRVRRSLESPE